MVAACSRRAHGRCMLPHPKCQAAVSVSASRVVSCRAMSCHVSSAGVCSLAEITAYTVVLAYLKRASSRDEHAANASRAERGESLRSIDRFIWTGDQGPGCVRRLPRSARRVNSGAAVARTACWLGACRGEVGGAMPRRRADADADADGQTAAPRCMAETPPITAAVR
jgi:hypothetical protein